MKDTEKDSITTGEYGAGLIRMYEECEGLAEEEGSQIWECDQD